MKKKLSILFAALAMVLLLCACGNTEISPDAEEYTIGDDSAWQISKLADFPNLKKIDGSKSDKYSAMLKLYNSMPDCEISWNYEFDGTVYPNTATELKATKLEGLDDAIRYLPELRRIEVVFSASPVKDKNLEKYREINPEAEYYWEYTLTDESPEEILKLAESSLLNKIDGSASTEYAAMLELYNTMPDCEVSWNYEFEGDVYPNSTSELKAESLEGLEDAIRYLPQLSSIDLFDTDVTPEDLERYYEINSDAEYYWQYTVTDESADEILRLAELKNLRKIDGTASSEYAALLELYNKLPDCEISWNYEFEGNVYPNTATELKATQLEGLEDAIRYLPELEYIDVVETEATVEDLDRYYEINPDAFYYWEFWHDNWRIRTDIQCYSSLRDINYHRFTDEEMYPMLKYCKNLRALDLGHNDLTDLTLIGKLDLDVLIIADNPNLVDASPIGNCKNLIYLEFFLNHKVEDYSWLNNLTKLQDLNLCYCDHLTELDFLQNMPDMKFVMLKYSGVSEEEWREWDEKLPDPYILFYDGNIHSCDSGWRETTNNIAIRRNFAHWPYMREYRSFDDTYINYNKLKYTNY